MKLSDIDDANTLVTKEFFNSGMGALEDRILNVFHKEMIDLLKWLALFLVGFATIVLGGVYFILSTMLVHWKP